MKSRFLQLWWQRSLSSLCWEATSLLEYLVDLWWQKARQTLEGVFTQARKGSLPLMLSSVPSESWHSRDGWKRCGFRAALNFCVGSHTQKSGARREGCTSWWFFFFFFLPLWHLVNYLSSQSLRIFVSQKFIAHSKHWHVQFFKLRWNSHNIQLTF